MHVASIKRRFSLGDRVIHMRKAFLGAGRITQLGVDVTHIYLGKNEWLAEHVSYATVEFTSGTLNVCLDDLVSERQAMTYDSLRVGDLVVHGKKRRRRALVIGAVPRSRSYAVKNRIIIIDEDGSKKSLPLRSEIVAVQHLEERDDA
jgi:hypothetical protein